MDRGVRDLEVAFCKANSTWFMTDVAKIYQTRPIYAVFKGLSHGILSYFEHRQNYR